MKNFENIWKLMQNYKNHWDNGKYEKLIKIVKLLKTSHSVWNKNTEKNEKKKCTSMTNEWKTAAFGMPGFDWVQWDTGICSFQKANAYSDTLSGWKQIKISFKDGAGDIKGGQARPRTKIEPRRANQIPLPPPGFDLVAGFFVWTILISQTPHDQLLWTICLALPACLILQPFERPVPVWHFFGLCSLWRTWILLRHCWSL